jgi:cytochrome c556
MKKTMMVLATSLLFATTAYAGDGTLKQAMQQLGMDFSALNHAILVEDFEGAATAAHAIAFHEKPSISQRMKIVKALGTEMPAFKKADGKVHDLAIEMEKAAQGGDMGLLIQHQSEMLGACMGCHTSYRAKVLQIME